jgi:hypothetical protein
MRRVDENAIEAFSGVAIHLAYRFNTATAIGTLFLFLSVPLLSISCCPLEPRGMGRPEPRENRAVPPRENGDDHVLTTSRDPLAISVFHSIVHQVHVLSKPLQTDKHPHQLHSPSLHYLSRIVR